MVASRRDTNQIHYLLDHTSRKIENYEELATHCVDFYSGLLGGDTQTLSQADIHLISSLMPFQCNAEMRDMLIAEVTPEEIKAKFFAFPRNKSLCPMVTHPNFLQLLGT